MRRYHNSEIVISHPPVDTAIFAVIFFLFGASFIFIGVTGRQWEITLGGLLFLSCGGFGIKSAFNPPLYFRADRQGVSFDLNTKPRSTQLVPWDNVVSFSEGTVSVRDEGRRNEEGHKVYSHEIPALQIEFDNALDFSSMGFQGKTEVTGYTFRIAEKQLQKPIPDVIAFLETMRDKHT